MDNPLASLKTGWWSFALPGYRDHPKPATYSLFSYEGLPPVEVPSDVNWHWLESQPPHERWSLAANGYPDGSKPDLSQLHRLIAQAGFRLPLHFTTFMDSPSLHARIRSCTACLLELSDFLVPTSAPPAGLMIQFLVDQQGCLRWYLFADALGNHCVLASPEVYGLAYHPDQAPIGELDLFHEDIWVCAQSFGQFIYRFWLENEIWFGLAEGRQPATKLQRDYLSHYT